jgi:hypothetical protein
MGGITPAEHPCRRPSWTVYLGASPFLVRFEATLPKWGSPDCYQICHGRTPRPPRPMLGDLFVRITLAGGSGGVTATLAWGEGCTNCPGMLRCVYSDHTGDPFGIVWDRCVYSDHTGDPFGIGGSPGERGVGLG